MDEVEERTKKQFRWGHLEDSEYQDEMIRISKLKKQQIKTISKYEDSLQRLKDVKDSVEKSTRFVTEQMRMLPIPDTVGEIIEETRDMGRIPKSADIFKELKVRIKQDEFLAEAENILEDLLKMVKIDKRRKWRFQSRLMRRF